MMVETRRTSSMKSRHRLTSKDITKSSSKSKTRKEHRSKSPTKSDKQSNSHKRPNTLKLSSRSKSRSFPLKAVANVIAAVPTARVYKRWIFVSIIGTLIASLIFIPRYFNSAALLMPERLGQVLSDYLFDSALFKRVAIIGDLEFLGNVTDIIRPFWKNEFEAVGSPGRLLRGKGVKAKYPVIMIPGITSTGLELWQGTSCAQAYFRQRLWGTFTMMRFMLMDSSCWMEHLRLNVTTGSDPDGIKLRPAQGLEAADFLIPGFWVWARIIENLAEIGYDHNSLLMAAYDWRLDVEQLEKRDHYFSRLKSQIELLVRTRKQKVVILSHSLGGIVWLYFMKWVEADEIKGNSDVIGGAGGKDWIEKHIQSVASIGAPYLGLPKTVSAIISGEMRDTAQLGAFESFLLEMLMNKKERLSLFRTWLGGFSMVPKGGNAFWGDEKMNGYNLVHFNQTLGITDDLHRSKHTADDIDEIITAFMPDAAIERVKRAYEWNGIAGPDTVKDNDKDPSTWTNPLLSRLPNAPSMKIYCLYGVGKETEVAYEYEFMEQPSTFSSLNFTKEELLFFQKSADVKDMLVKYKIKLGAADKSKRLSNGIYHVDGDGTVPLISNGYMCAHGWRRYSHWNPGNVTTIAREYRHEPSGGLGELRGGPKTSDHVDILGNYEMTMDILKIVSDFHEEDKLVEEHIVSDIKNLSLGIQLPF